MRLLLMRFKSVNMLVINRFCLLDNSYRDRGHCSAQRLIPERADYYKVNSQWQHNDDDWQLFKLELD